MSMFSIVLKKGDLLTLIHNMPRIEGIIYNPKGGFKYEIVKNKENDVGVLIDFGERFYPTNLERPIDKKYYVTILINGKLCEIHVNTIDKVNNVRLHYNEDFIFEF